MLEDKEKNRLELQIKQLETERLNVIKTLSKVISLCSKDKRELKDAIYYLLYTEKVPEEEIEKILRLLWIQLIFIFVDYV